jgi:hypothetical protein
MARTKRNAVWVLLVLALLLAGWALWLGRGRVAPSQSEVAEDAVLEAGAPGDFLPPTEAHLPEEAAAEATAEPDGEPPATATAWIVRGDGTRVELKAIDHEFARLDVETNEVLTIRLSLTKGDSARPVLVEADNGGSLERQVGPLVLPPAEDGISREFRYAVGGNKGKYSLCISQGDRQEVLPFYAGQEPRTGVGGPPRSFHPDPPQRRHEP